MMEEKEIKIYIQELRKRYKDKEGLGSMARRKPLPDATPLLGERGLDAIQVGYLSGYLKSGSDGIPSLDSSWLCDSGLSSSLDLKAVKKIREKLHPLRKSRSRLRYIEDFIAEVEARRQGNYQIQRFYDAVYALEKRDAFPHPIGVGFVAVQFYHHDP